MKNLGQQKVDVPEENNKQKNQSRRNGYVTIILYILRTLSQFNF